MSLSVFVVVQEEGSYSDKDWKIHGVFNDLHSAKIAGWLRFLKEVSRDYTLKFYQNRNAEFAHLRGISDYHIQEWEKDVRKSVTYLVHDDRMDKFLKQLVVNGEDLPTVLQDWKSQLEHGVFPEVFENMTVYR